jgi:hypothetical protein
MGQSATFVDAPEAGSRKGFRFLIFSSQALRGIVKSSQQDQSNNEDAMRKEPASRLLQLAWLFAAEAAGIGLDEIAAKFAVGRRTAERMRDSSSHYGGHDLMESRQMAINIARRLRCFSPPLMGDAASEGSGRGEHTSRSAHVTNGQARNGFQAVASHLYC